MGLELNKVGPRSNPEQAGPSSSHVLPATRACARQLAITLNCILPTFMAQRRPRAIETLSAVAVGIRSVRAPIEPTPPHITPRPFPLTCGPTAPPRSPPSASHSSLPLSSQDAMREESGACAAGAEGRECLPGWDLLNPGPRRRHLLLTEVSSA